MNQPRIIEDLRAGIETEKAADTEAAARAFATVLPANAVLALSGDLGAGKTTFIRGMARAWGIEAPVTSPTFNLYTIHSGERQLVHLDAYRLESPAELDALMIEDFLVEPWCLAVEWPEHVADWLPDRHWRLSLRITGRKTHAIRLEDAPA